MFKTDTYLQVQRTLENHPFVSACPSDLNILQVSVNCHAYSSQCGVWKSVSINFVKGMSNIVLDPQNCSATMKISLKCLMNKFLLVAICAECILCQENTKTPLCCRRHRPAIYILRCLRTEKISTQHKARQVGREVCLCGSRHAY